MSAFLRWVAPRTLTDRVLVAGAVLVVVLALLDRAWLVALSWAVTGWLYALQAATSREMRNLDVELTASLKREQFWRDKATRLARELLARQP